MTLALLAGIYATPLIAVLGLFAHYWREAARSREDREVEALEDIPGWGAEWERTP